MADKSALLKSAQKYLAKGQIDKAIGEWEKIAQDYPDATTYNMLGDLYMKAQDAANAVLNLHKASKIFRDGGFSLKALAIYKKILNIKPNDADALFALGELNEEKSIVTDAIRYYLASADVLSKENKKDRLPVVYQKIVKAAPSNIPLRVKVAEMYSREAFVAEAAREYCEIAGLYIENEQDDNAMTYYRKAMEIKPGFINAVKGLATLYEKSGDTDRALEYMKRVMESEGENRETLLKIAGIYIASGSYIEALDYAVKASEMDPSDIDAKKLIGEIHENSGDITQAWEAYSSVIDEIIFKERYDEAVAILEKFRSHDPVEASKKLISLYNQKEDSEGAYTELSTLAAHYNESGMLQEALNCYKELLNLKPDVPEVQEAIGNIESQLGVSEEKEEKTVEEMLTDADIFVRYGLLNEAIELLKNIKNKDPENPEPLIRLKNLYKESGQAEQAVGSAIALAELYEGLGMPDKKDSVVAEAFSINPSDSRLTEKFGAPPKVAAPPAEPGPAVAAATLEAEAQEPTEGYMPEQQQYEDIEPEGLEAHAEELTEADFYAREGLYSEAAEIYRKLLELFPDNEELKQKLADTEVPEQEVDAAINEEIAEEEDLISLEGFLTDDDVVDDVPTAGEPALASDVLDIFEEFKKGLASELEGEDSETHYNLGIAYKEMGLIDDSIREFQTTAHDPQFFVQAQSMLGICYMQKGLFPIAIDAFSSALMKVEKGSETYWSLQYDLAEAYERSGNLKEAMNFYSNVYGWNAGFRDAASKVEAIKNQLQKHAQPAAEKPTAEPPEDKTEPAPPKEPPPAQSNDVPKKKKSRVSYI